MTAALHEFEGKRKHPENADKCKGLLYIIVVCDHKYKKIANIIYTSVVIVLRGGITNGRLHNTESLSVKGRKISRKGQRE